MTLYALNIELTLFIGVFGMIIGSFLNVLIYRLPRGESIVNPGSHCPVCGQPLRPWELIPIFSFIIQKGRCRNCQSSISWRYPAIELLTGVLFSLEFWLRGEAFDIKLIFDLVFISFLIALTFIDIDTMTLPDKLVLPLIVIGILGAGLSKEGPNIWESLAGAITAGGLFFIVAWLYPQGMGWGDVKFVAALGAFVGFPGIYSAVFLASLTGVIVSGSIFLLKKSNFKKQIPFGPYLSFGALSVLFLGEKLINFNWLTIFGR